MIELIIIHKYSNQLQYKSLKLNIFHLIYIRLKRSAKQNRLSPNFHFKSHYAFFVVQTTNNVAWQNLQRINNLDIWVRWVPSIYYFHFQHNAPNVQQYRYHHSLLIHRFQHCLLVFVSHITIHGSLTRQSASKYGNTERFSLCRAVALLDTSPSIPIPKTILSSPLINYVGCCFVCTHFKNVFLN